MIMDKEKKCRDCGATFMQKSGARYPRKYCDKCSKVRKKEYEKIHTIKFEDCDDEDE